ncbi:MAG: hypothetical protein QOI76_466 [Frankiales bacterium]|jgi:uncharacterized protein (DUF1015 family)|nr:hypothetical protein [Frankiales bacterium]
MTESSASPAVVRPIELAWVSRGRTGAPNYDEFNTYDEIAGIIAANPTSILTVDMPHATPEGRKQNLGFFDALPEALPRLQQLKADGHFAQARDVVLPYRITTPNGPSYGVWAMVSTAEISDAADKPGLVIRNEEVFVDKVKERTALIGALGHLISAVLLLQSDRGPEVVAQLMAWTEGRDPDAVDIDQFGQEHAVWLMQDSPERDALIEALAGGELIVADGNHRSLASQQSGLDAFLAVITAPESLTIQPYNRLMRSLGLPLQEFLGKLKSAGFEVTQVDGPVGIPAERGTIGLYAGDGYSYEVGLPAAEGSVVDTLDHTVVERALFNDVLGMDAADKRIAYVGGDYGADWLRAEVDGGRAEAAIMIAPVSTDDFVAINHDRMKMPRKSTWFTPKARAGLVLAEL